MSYEAGFDAGERQSFRDRQTGERMHRPTFLVTSWERGFWAGYQFRDRYDPPAEA